MKPKYALEMVSFQDDALFKLLTAEIHELRKKPAKELVDMGFSTGLSDLIKKFTNLNCKVWLEGPGGAAVEIPDVKRNHVFLNSLQRAYFKGATGKDIIAQAQKGFCKGSVDIDKATVSGVFAEIEHRIHLHAGLLKKESFSNTELAAILLHELGHVFTYYEYITRTVTTNQVLEGISRTLSSTDDKAEIEAVLVTARQALRLTDLDVKALTKSTNQKTVEMVIFSSVVEHTRSQLGSDIYDANGWEMLADNFATRLGAGRDLVTALNKLYSGSHSSYRSTGYFLFLEAAKVTSFVAGTLLLTAGFIGLGGLSFIAFINLFAADLNSTTYDRPGIRIKRIRDQVALRLRDKAISANERKQLEEDLVYLDESLKTINDRNQLFTVLGSFFFKSVRARYQQERLQAELETLANHDLFRVFS